MFTPTLDHLYNSPTASHLPAIASDGIIINCGILETFRNHNISQKYWKHIGSNVTKLQYIPHDVRAILIAIPDPCPYAWHGLRFCHKKEIRSMVYWNCCFCCSLVTFSTFHVLRWPKPFSVSLVWSFSWTSTPTHSSRKEVQFWELFESRLLLKVEEMWGYYALDRSKKRRWPEIWASRKSVDTWFDSTYRGIIHI